MSKDEISITGHLTTRPIRLGFSVDMTDSKEVSKVMEIASSYWGGHLHCLMPEFVSARPSKVWQRNNARFQSVSQIRSDLFWQYEFDYFVGPKKKLENGEFASAGTLSRSEMLKGAPNPTCSYGVSSLSALREFLCDEKDDLKGSTLLLSDGASIVLDAYLMKPRRGQNSWLQKQFENIDEIDVRKLGVSNYLQSLVELDWWTLIEGAVFQLKQPFYRKSEVIFLACESNSSIDAFDLWNLRAQGYQPIPIFTDALLGSESYDLVSNLIRGTHRKGMESPFDLPTLTKSRGITDRVFKSFVNELAESLGERKQPIANVAWSIPRYWNKKESIERRFPNNRSTEWKKRSIEQGVKFESEVRLAVDFPVFAGVASETPAIAHEVEIKTWGDPRVAECFLPNLRFSLKNCKLPYLEDHRFSDNSIIFLKHGFGERLWFSLPLATEMHTAALQGEGSKIKLSHPGGLLERMILSLGGISMVGIIAEEGLLALLMNVKDTPVEKFRGSLKRLKSKSSNFYVDIEALIKNLVTRNILKIGVKITCPTCERSFTQSLDQLDYELECPVCFDSTTHHCYVSKGMEMVYNRSGVFAVDRKALGVPVVALSLLFLQRALRCSVNLGGSFEFSGEKAFEIDIVTSIRSGAWWETSTRLVFGECKSHYPIDANDVKLLSRLGDQYPRSILLVATYKPSFDENEKTRLRKLAKSLRAKFLKNGQGSNLLLLTSAELENPSGPNLWGVEHKDLTSFSKTMDLGVIDAHCFASQVKNLDLEARDIQIYQEPFGILSPI